MRLQLDLLQHQNQLRVRTESGQRYVRGHIRRHDLVLTPEEWVRQLLLQHLVGTMTYPVGKIAVERGLRVHQLHKRCDILVFDPNFQPWMLIECKAPRVELSAATFHQIAIYNLPLRVPYLMVSNGRESYVCAMHYATEEWKFLDQLPPYPTR